MNGRVKYLKLVDVEKNEVKMAGSNEKEKKKKKKIIRTKKREESRKKEERINKTKNTC